MWPVNSTLRAILATVMAPLAGLPVLVGVLIWSALLALLILLVYRHASDQRRLAEVKRSIHACLFEIRLFNDDLGAILRAQLEILRHNLTYLRLSVVPMLWVMLPLAVLIGHLHGYFGYRALAIGESAILTVELAAAPDGDGAPPKVELDLPAGLRLETPPVWVGERRQVAWRLGAVAEGDHAVTIRLGDRTWVKSVRVGADVRVVSPERVGPGLLGQILWPAEPPLPGDAAVRAVTLAYPAAALHLGPWSSASPSAWMIVLLLASMAFALVLRRPLGVTI